MHTTERMTARNDSTTTKAGIAVVCWVALLALGMSGLLTGCEFSPEGFSPGSNPGGDPGVDPGVDPGPDPVGPPSVEWWDVDFSHRIQISFANSMRDEDLGNIPVLVTLDGSKLSYGDLQANGEDLRFVDADGVTELDHEIERWDRSGESFVWVNVPRIDGKSDADYMYLYYGNPGAPSTANASKVWQAANYLGVYHLSDTLSQNTDSIRDSSGRNFNGSDVDALGSTQRQTGIAADALSFAGGNDRVDIRDNLSFAVPSGAWRTMETWFNAPPGSSDRHIWYKEIGCRGWTIFLDGSGKVRGSFGTTLTTSGICASNGFQYSEFIPTSATRLDDNQWHYAAFVLDRELGKGQLFIDGELAVEAAIETGRIGEGNVDAQIGHVQPGVDTKSFVGLIDETRISLGTRTPAWISAQYASMKGTLLGYAAPESRPAIP